MAVIVTVRKVYDKSQTTEIIKQDLPLWINDGWELYGVETDRPEVVTNSQTVGNSIPSSLPPPKIDTVTLSAELTEAEFFASLPSDLMTEKLATALYKSSIRSIRQLKETSDEKLLSIPGIGRAKLKDIRDGIKNLN